MLANTDWPKADPEMLTEESVEIGVQVNGKLRDTVSLPVDAEEVLPGRRRWHRPV